MFLYRHTQTHTSGCTVYASVSYVASEFDNTSILMSEALNVMLRKNTCNDKTKNGDEMEVEDHKLNSNLVMYEFVWLYHIMSFISLTGHTRSTPNILHPGSFRIIAALTAFSCSLKSFFNSLLKYVLVVSHFRLLAGVGLRKSTSAGTLLLRESHDLQLPCLLYLLLPSPLRSCFRLQFS